MDASLLITLAIVFFATLIGSALGSIRKDRCLADFGDFHVTLEHADGRVIWGVMRILATGFELVYRNSVRSEQALVKTSYVFYRDEYAHIQGLYRYTDDLDPAKRRERDRSLRRAFHPGPVSYLTRRLRNFTNTATDSLSEMLTLVLGRSRPLQTELVMASGQKHLSGLTKDVLGYVGTSYDPVLESFVGAEAVVEMRVEDTVYEYVGVLKDYSADFLEVLDVEFCQPLSLVARQAAPGSASAGSAAATLGIRTSLHNELLIVTNTREDPIMLCEVVVAGQEMPVEAIIDPGREYRHVLCSRADAVELNLRTIRLLDMILPRSVALLRHRAERYRTSDALNARLQLERLLDDPEEDTDLDRALLKNEQIREADRRLAKTLQQRDRSAATAQGPLALNADPKETDAPSDRSAG